MQARTKLTVALALLALGAVAIAPMLAPKVSSPLPIPASPVTTEAALFAAEESPVVAVETPEIPIAAPAPVATVAQPAAKPARDVDLVIALDTSSSMDGLINSARAKLWDIVNDVAKQEPDARLRVGLIAFGTPTYGEANGYVKVVTDLSSELDKVYGQAMALTTDGGDEYVGWAIQTALGRMSWSDDDTAARILFVAGNESANQGPIGFDKAARSARERGILVNALFAGDKQGGIGQHWAELASAGGGIYSNIDMVRGTVQMATPQDAALQRFNSELNGTYRGYGKNGASGSAAQAQADSASSGLGSGTMSARVSSKGSAMYGNAGWDIVDGVQAGKVDLASVDDADLPPDLRGKTVEEREAAVKALQAERSRIQAEIRRLSAERERFLKENRKKGEVDSLDEATSRAIAEQL